MLTLITVNYNGAEKTIALLRSLEQQTNKQFDVIVVDNDSAPADRALLGEYAAASHLRLDVIYSDTNRGFSGGNNLGIRKALAQESEWILWINNDTTVDPDFIVSIISSSELAPSKIVGIPLREGGRIAFAGEVRWLKPTLPHVSDWGEFKRLQFSDTVYAIGAGILIHRDVFEKVGFLDERYFLYFEDADFCMRARRAGVPIHFLQDTTITHSVSQSTKHLGRPLLLRYHARNSLLFNWNNGPWWVKAAVPILAGSRAAFQFLKSILLPSRRAESQAILAGILDFVCGRWGIIDTRLPIGIECEAIEGSSWGVARMLRELLHELARRPELAQRYRFHLYFKSQIPDGPWKTSSLFETSIIRLPKRLPVPVSFSLYYYVLLPLKLAFDRPAAMYWPNYMLPIIHPPFVQSMVMLTEDVYREARNARRPLRYRAGYLVFCTWAAWFATRIMAISHTSGKEISRLFGVPSSRIIANPLGITGMVPHTTGGSTESSTFLFVGQAFPRRHLKESLQAFVQLARERESITFRIIGTDQYPVPTIGALVERINRDLGRVAVQWIEHVDEPTLAAAYRSALALLYVSETEAFGLPPIEALAAGTPPVVADTALNHEIYSDHAFFVPTPVTEQGITDTMRRALEDSAQREHILAAAPAIAARYTWQAHTDRWLAAMDGMMNK